MNSTVCLHTNSEMLNLDECCTLNFLTNFYHSPDQQRAYEIKSALAYKGRLRDPIINNSVAREIVNLRYYTLLYRKNHLPPLTCTQRSLQSLSVFIYHIQQEFLQTSQVTYLCINKNTFIVTRYLNIVCATGTYLSLISFHKFEMYIDSDLHESTIILCIDLCYF